MNSFAAEFDEIWPLEEEMFYIVLFCVSLGVAALTIPALRRFAYSHNIMMDAPNERKVHKKPIPRIGGIGIALAVLIAIIVGVAAEQDILGGKLLHTTGIILGGLFIVLLGVLDDIEGLNARWKFSGQIIAASILIVFGIRIRTIHILFWNVTNLPLSVSIFITVFWVLTVTNALNLVDGIDGLAGGIALIASGILCCLAIINGQVSAAIVTISLVGACSGFLRYNYPPASVFMGDCGSMFLGFMLAAASIQFRYKTSVASILIPITVLAVPLADTFLAIVRRIWNGRSPFHADKEHIHHRLLEIGLSQRHSLIVLYGLCIFLGTAALTATVVGEGTAAIIITTAGITLVSVFVLISQYANKRNDRQEKERLDSIGVTADKPFGELTRVTR